MSHQAEVEIVLDEFAFRQFDDPNYAGTRIDYDKIKFQEKVNQYYEERKSIQTIDRPVLVDGYAPFCKHIFMPNFTNARVGVLRITPENEHLLRTKYEARTEKELPVLIRYFPKEKVPELPVAMYLDLILYSREQINKETLAMCKKKEPSTAPWGLISIKAQDEPYELPMSPITVMRNELISQGGSGVAIDRKAYMAAYEYWKDHAIIA